MPEGISKTTFIAGLVVAILASSALSTVIATQWARGPEGTAGTDGVDGEDGKSAYQIWLDQGNSGTEQDFVDSLKGEQGPAGVFTVENLTGWLPAPAWDSGWTNATNQPPDPAYPVFWHGLNTTNVLIHIQANGTVTHTIRWFTETEMQIDRYGDQSWVFRVMIWKISEEP